MKINIVAAIVDVNHLTLYKEDGTTLQIPQGDPRIRRIIAESQETLLAGGVAEVDLSHPGVEYTNTSFRDFEESTNGIVRFFKTTKQAVMKAFGAADDSPEVQDAPVGNMVMGQFGVNKDFKVRDHDPVEEILSNAKKVSEDTIQEDETIVVAVGDQIIENGEALRPQIAHAVTQGKTQGMVKLLKRLSRMTQTRRHSVDSLVSFLEKGDLPVADNGDIIIYKMLNLRDPEARTYVDIHSGKVVQSVGSIVQMDPSMVDESLSHECSQGLHVARRAYLGSFSGNVCVIGRVRPEDVIAVPHRDPNKMRVCRYEILAELDDEAFRQVKANKPFSPKGEAQKQLTLALKGKFPKAFEVVNIGGPRGTDITIVTLGKKSKRTVKKVSETKVKKTAPIRLKDDPVQKDEAVDPKKLSKKIVKVKSLTRKERINKLIYVLTDTKAPQAKRTRAGEELLALRRAAKKSWKALGFPALEDAQIQKDIESIKTAKPSKKPKKQPAKRKTRTEPKAKPTTREEIFRHFEQGNWNSLLAAKRKAKKSWEKLGFNKTQINKINKAMKNR